MLRVKESDKPLKIIGVSREITERKKVEQQQNELIRKLGEALAEKERTAKRDQSVTWAFADMQRVQKNFVST